MSLLDKVQDIYAGHMNYHRTQFMFIAYLIFGLRVASHDQEGEVRSCEKRTFMKVHFTTASVEI